MRHPEIPAWFCRFGPAGSLLAVFLGMSWLYRQGQREISDSILRSWGILPFQTPFLDTSGPLSAWDCARQGWEVMLENPCHLLHEVFDYSPFWLIGARIPLGLRDTTAVGLALDILFILSLTLLPPPRRFVELLLVLAATFSTMVVFALERANADLLLFMLALATGLLAERGSVSRIIGYALAVFAALLKYYPIMVLVVLFRERIAFFVAIALVTAGSLAVFWAAYHAEIAIGLTNVTTGPYNTDLFAAKNLPFQIGDMIEKASMPSRFTLALSWAETAGLYAALVGAALAICRRLLRLPGLPAAIAELSGLERTLMVIGSAVIAGCFFAGQSIGYRGVFLLLLLPGLLALSRSADSGLRMLCLGSAIVIVLLMWGECLRLALGGGFWFWLLRELGWWWSVTVMLALVANFLRESPVLSGRWSRPVLQYLGSR